jgi:hypothetical protein
MKNFLLSLIAIFMMSSIVYAKNDDGRKPKKISVVKKDLKKAEERVDSFKIIEETSTEDANRFPTCKITVNYYYQGQFVLQQSYTGHPCPLFGSFNCKDWREDVLDTINFWIDHYGTSVPAGTDMSC